ncbi:MAG: hypothetical protein ABI777_09515 [Betaproteobacteria bacterium]
MVRRAIGLIVLAFYGYVTVFGIRAVLTDSSIGHGIAEFASNYGQDIDPENWVLHWRTRGIFLACFGFFGIFAGAAIFMRKRTGWLLLAMSSFAYLIYEWAVYATPFYAYAFERPHVGRSVALLAVTIGAVIAYRGSRKDHTNVLNA